MVNEMRKSLAPAPLNLGKERLFHYYARAIDDGFDEFYLGEVSCPRRGAESRRLLLDLARLIKDRGKTLFISSYALVTEMGQIDGIQDILLLADGLEVNNLAFLELGFDRRLIAGCFLNIYNSQAATLYKGLGFERVVLPPDLRLESIVDIAEFSGIEVEVLARGRKPLALSRRCYTLRALGLSDDQCAMNCFSYPHGLSLDTIFRLNGREVFSEKVCSLREDFTILEDAGVEVLRFEGDHSG